MEVRGFTGTKGEIEVYDDRLIIRRKALSDKLAGFSLLKDKEIYYEDICDIKVKPSGINTGYIFFDCYSTPKIKEKDIALHENTVLFKGKQSYREALQLKNNIENIKVCSNQSTNTLASNADELLKLKSLLDNGVITEEEFLKEKDEILNNKKSVVNKSKISSTTDIEHAVENNTKLKYIGIVAGVLFLIAFFIVTSSDTPAPQPTNEIAQEASSLSDVQAWYENEMPLVGESLMNYASGIEGVTDVNVNASHFYFGGEYSDCYYKFTFTCRVNGEEHIGEARAFLKYQDSNVQWFSFEIFSNDGIQSVVELYDDTYDQIIVDYYSELVATYPQ